MPSWDSTLWYPAQPIHMANWNNLSLEGILKWWRISSRHDLIYKLQFGHCLDGLIHIAWSWLIHYLTPPLEVGTFWACVLVSRPVFSFEFTRSLHASNRSLLDIHAAELAQSSLIWTAGSTKSSSSWKNIGRVKILWSTTELAKGYWKRRIVLSSFFFQSNFLARALLSPFYGDIVIKTRWQSE